MRDDFDLLAECCLLGKSTGAEKFTTEVRPMSVSACGFCIIISHEINNNNYTRGIYCVYLFGIYLGCSVAWNSSNVDNYWGKNTRTGVEEEEVEPKRSLRHETFIKFCQIFTGTQVSKDGRVISLFRLGQNFWNVLLAKRKSARRIDCFR